MSDSEWNRLQRRLDLQAPVHKRAEAERFSSQLWIRKRYICGGCGEEREAEFRDGKVLAWYRCPSCLARKRGKRI